MNTLRNDFIKAELDLALCDMRLQLELIRFQNNTAESEQSKGYWLGDHAGAISEMERQYSEAKARADATLAKLNAESSTTKTIEIDADRIELEIAEELERNLCDKLISPEEFVSKNRQRLKEIINNAITRKVPPITGSAEVDWSDAPAWAMWHAWDGPSGDGGWYFEGKPEHIHTDSWVSYRGRSKPSRLPKPANLAARDTLTRRPGK